jgi:SAM-dependent methyltransferase
LLEERMFGTAERFAYGDCAGCGTTQIVDVPQDLDRHYPDAYYSVNPHVGAVPGWFATTDVERLAPAVVDFQVGVRPPNDPAVRQQLHSLEARFIAYYLPELAREPTRRVLDVGCGRGELVDGLAASGIDARGVDPYVRDPSARVQQGELNDVDGTFHHILVQHVLEHVADPRALLRAARERLEPDGRVLVRIPLVDNHLVATHGDAWFGYDPPRHLFALSERAFGMLARDAGLRIVASQREENLWSVLATEQWRASMPAMHRRSLLRDPSVAEDPFDIVDARSRARRANREGDGDQGAFVLVVAD